MPDPTATTPKPSADAPQRRRRARDGARVNAPKLPAGDLGAPQRAPVLRQAWWLMRKDVSVELRTRETLLTLLFFALVLVVIFTFSFWVSDELAMVVTPGVIWVSVAFAGILAIDRSFAQEHEGETLTALVLVPGVARALYIAKTCVNIAYMTLIEALVVPMTLWMLGTSVTWAQVAVMALILALGTGGFAAVGTVFSAMLVAIRRRGVMLPIVLYPVAIPLLVLGVKATAALIERRPDPEVWSLIRLMAAIDVLYLVAGAWLFGTILEDD